jgi:virginiamycin B lyase
VARGCGLSRDQRGAGHIYWANFGTGTIGEANLNGTGVNQNFITGADCPIGVAVSP